MTFDTKVDRRHVQMVHFVNCDAPTTLVFVDTFKSLHGSLRMGMASNDQREQDKGEKTVGCDAQIVPDIERNQTTSASDDVAHQQNIDVHEHQLTVDLSPGMNTDHNAAVQVASFTTGSNNFSSTGSHEVVPQYSDPYKMVTPCGIVVHIYCGNIIDEKVDAIVNPADARLIHGSGISRAIAAAAGRQLEEECTAYIRQHKELKVTQAMHTTAGKMNPPITYVIHVSRPSASLFPNPDDLCKAVFDTFDHCMLYANDVLRISSMSIPAISSGKEIIFFLINK